jgi:hypothetical protein
MAAGDDDDHRSHVDSLENNVTAVLLQLQSARASLLRLYPDEICLGIMDDCIASFKAQHDQIDQAANEAIVWEETSMEDLLRLLDYLHSEINDGLNDRPSAKQLRLCTDRLRQILML